MRPLTGHFGRNVGRCPSSSSFGMYARGKEEEAMVPFPPSQLGIKARKGGGGGGAGRGRERGGGSERRRRREAYFGVVHSHTHTRLGRRGGGGSLAHNHIRQKRVCASDLSAGEAREFVCCRIFSFLGLQEQEARFPSAFVSPLYLEASPPSGRAL